MIQDIWSPRFALLDSHSQKFWSIFCMGFLFFRRLRRPRGRLPGPFSRNQSLLLITLIYIVIFLIFLTHGVLFCRGLLYSAFYNQSDQNEYLSKRDQVNEASAARFVEALIDRYRIPETRLSVLTNGTIQSTMYWSWVIWFCGNLRVW